MADVAEAVRPLPRQRRLPASGIVLVVLAALAWAGTIIWATSRNMSAMPGTMGLGPGEFVAMWALMMAAMMLPSVWPFVGVYERTIRAHRAVRLGGLAGGYLLAWAAVGVAAYGVAWVFGELASDRPGVARAVAVAAFLALGVYQLTPLKFLFVREWCCDIV
jgi:predicted metal-binding membrane protein